MPTLDDLVGVLVLTVIGLLILAEVENSKKKKAEEDESTEDLFPDFIIPPPENIKPDPIREHTEKVLNQLHADRLEATEGIAQFRTLLEEVGKELPEPQRQLYLSQFADQLVKLNAQKIAARLLNAKDIQITLTPPPPPQPKPSFKPPTVTVPPPEPPKKAEEELEIGW